MTIGTIEREVILGIDRSELSEDEVEFNWDWMTVYRRHRRRSQTVWQEIKTKLDCALEVDFLEDVLSYYVKPDVGIGAAVRLMELMPSEEYFEEAYDLARINPLTDIRHLIISSEDNDEYCVAALAFVHYELFNRLTKPISRVDIEIEGNTMYRTWLG